MKGVWTLVELGRVRRSGKHLFISETVREHKLDFIILLETGISNYSAPFLKHLSRGLDYMWYCLPPHGKSGGILVGLNVDTISIQKVETCDLCVKLFVRNKLDDFEWILVGVYGVAQEALKPNFLAGLVRICEK
jgi:hypothetical protein